MHLALIGAPGIGKTTLARNLFEHFKMPIISSGQMFRSLAEEGNDIGIKARDEYWGKGRLVPDELAIPLFNSWFRKPEYHSGSIIDGVPRTLVQASGLNDMLYGAIKPIHIYGISDEDLVKRAVNRRFCSNKKCGEIYALDELPKESKRKCLRDSCGSKLFIREDDKSREVIKERLKEYHAGIGEVLEYYGERGDLIGVEANVPPKLLYWHVLDELRGRERSA